MYMGVGQGGRGLNPPVCQTSSRFSRKPVRTPRVWYHFGWCTLPPPILNLGNPKKEVPLFVETVARLYGLGKLDASA